MQMFNQCDQSLLAAYAANLLQQLAHEFLNFSPLVLSPEASLKGGLYRPYKQVLFQAYIKHAILIFLATHSEHYYMSKINSADTFQVCRCSSLPFICYSVKTAVSYLSHIVFSSEVEY